MRKAARKIMAASARWKTQGRNPGVRGARSRGMENVALNEITTATCAPSEIATVCQIQDVANRRG